jgi:hypothetical protein
MTAIAIGACGGGPSLTEYAAVVEDAVAAMNAEVDAAHAEFDSDVPTPARAGLLMDRRAAARSAFVAFLEDLEPPEEAEELHALALQVVDRLSNAEAALAAKAAATAPADLDLLWNSAEARQLEAVDESAVAMCNLAQETFDSTSEREGFSGSSWMPPALKEVVDVAFRCSADERN